MSSPIFRIVRRPPLGWLNKDAEPVARIYRESSSGVVHRRLDLVIAWVGVASAARRGNLSAWTSLYFEARRGR